MRRQKIVFWVGLLALPFLGLIFTSSLSKRKSIIEEVRFLEQEAKRVTEENSRLRQTIEGVQSEVLKELEVRKKFNYAKPGEVLVLFVSPSPVPSPSPEIRWWQRLFR